MLSWLTSLAAHVSFRRKATEKELQSLPMRSRLGMWGSVLGFTLVTVAILRTWWDSRVNLVSGITYLALFSVAYAVMRKIRRPSTILP